MRPTRWIQLQMVPHLVVVQTTICELQFASVFNICLQCCLSSVQHSVENERVYRQCLPIQRWIHRCVTQWQCVNVSLWCQFIQMDQSVAAHQYHSRIERVSLKQKWTFFDVLLLENKTRRGEGTFWYIQSPGPCQDKIRWTVLALIPTKWLHPLDVSICPSHRLSTVLLAKSFPSAQVDQS